MMKIKLIKALIAWLDKHYHYLLLDIVIPAGQHLHKNPRKVKK